MEKKIFSLLAIAVALLLSGCSITGQTAAMLDSEIVGCSIGTSMDFLRINGLVQACYKGSTLYFVLDNTGTVPISGLELEIGPDHALTTVVKQAIAAGESSSQKLNFGAQQFKGDVMLKVAPYIGESSLLCTNVAIETILEEC